MIHRTFPQLRQRSILRHVATAMLCCGACVRFWPKADIPCCTARVRYLRKRGQNRNAAMPIAVPGRDFTPCSRMPIRNNTVAQALGRWCGALRAVKRRDCEGRAPPSAWPFPYFQ